MNLESMTKVILSIRVFLIININVLSVCLIYCDIFLSVLPTFHTKFLSWGKMKKRRKTDLNKQTPVTLRLLHVRCLCSNTLSLLINSIPFICTLSWRDSFCMSFYRVTLEISPIERYWHCVGERWNFINNTQSIC